ncbi:MAG: RagB/SusD family nutrient uptake outer membrane protein [Bacteroidales bacterium]|nr:RagB/SusD family nutrient uptake outer membrane protein [Bacteroidales bacterium]
MNNKFLKYAFILVAGCSITFTACDDVFEPIIENNKGMDMVVENGDYIGGVLGYAYATLPYNSKSDWDVATDDATTNDANSAYVAMSTSWSAQNSPINQWQTRLCTINNLNIYVANNDGVEWSSDEIANQLYTIRGRGEAYALRALNMYYLLMLHGGKSSDGQFLGFPLFTEPFPDGFDYNMPRATIQECVNQIYADLDAAISILPEQYTDIDNDSQVPEQYKALGASASQYNRVFGAHLKGRVDRTIAEAIKSQVALLMASPAFEGATSINYDEAAKLAGNVLAKIGGINGLDPKGNTWFCNEEIDGLGGGVNPKEILWRGNLDRSDADYALGSDQEVNNFPPTLNGKGRINPSQNLVDAFPMENGFPITSSNSNYNPQNPYEGRDPRLAKYIVYDGAKLSNKAIETGSYSGTTDGLRKSDNATITGYYLRKLLREDVIISNSGDKTTRPHYHARIRYTEIFLNYAEAANEAWGPNADGGFGFSAFDVVKAIRQRAGISGGDGYLMQCTSKEQLRELIRNERRIELCFENKRFWDLRRWNLTEKMNETVKGINITNDGTQKVYTIIDVANRSYQPYMIYGPIPNDEITKWSNLVQNQGW